MTDPISLSKFTRKLSYASTGVLGDSNGFNVFGLNSLRVTGDIELNGILLVEARLESETTWTTILTITGTGSKQSNTVFVDTWDYIRYRCTNFIATGAYIYTSGFHGSDSLIPSSGQDINPLAKYMEMTETSSTIETYRYYESSSKVTLYNTITVTFTDATKNVLASVEWS